MHQYVLRRLAQSKGHWREVSREAGVAYRTLEKIARQEHKDPRVSQIEKLISYFRRPTTVRKLKVWSASLSQE